jgi:hypothetical protein
MYGKPGLVQVIMQSVPPEFNARFLAYFASAKEDEEEAVKIETCV